MRPAVGIAGDAIRRATVSFVGFDALERHWADSPPNSRWRSKRVARRQRLERARLLQPVREK
jgi:hypothetical protein